MNEILQAIYARKSVRVYTEEEIFSKDKESILQAALQAPSAGCQLLYTILDITDQEKKEKLAQLCDHQPFIAKAKMALVFCADCRKWLSFYKEAGLTPRNPGSGNWFLLYRGCDGKRGSGESAFGTSKVCVSCLYAGFRVSHQAAEGEEEAGAV